MRRATLGLLAAAVVATAALAAGSAQAAPPTSVVIQGHTVFADGYGTFTTSGAGLCASGTTTDQLLVSGGGGKTLFHVLKTFTCDDQSGTFVVNLQAVAAPVFRWNVVSGTGAYTNLHGSGSGVGVGFLGGVDDTYTGMVHFT